ncbi:MAG: hypothetical protein IKE46_08010 [Selenomonadaceae bacterium]|nr:hypothetical protein [Selenomonadaceae bacterium]MBR4384190.1 hypothetical protein [Selenomonadaceae bacterium]
MKRPIKFRARNEYGEVFYGSFDEDTCTIDCWDIAETVVVERDSVAQLVGYDADGNEVYEGDELVSVDNGTVWVAVLNPTVTLPKYEHLESSNLELIGLKLQENQS